jgi:hypothetical protein
VGKKRGESGVGVRMGDPGTRVGRRRNEVVAVVPVIETAGRLGVKTAPEGFHVGESGAARKQAVRKRRRPSVQFFRRIG